MSHTLTDHLKTLSVAELRGIADSFNVALSGAIMSSRQLLVGALAQFLNSPRIARSLLEGLDSAGLAVLRTTVQLGSAAGESRVAEVLQRQPAEIRLLLEQLRRGCLLFPNGDWEHILVTDVVRRETERSAWLAGAALSLDRPALDPGTGLTDARPGSFEGDLATIAARLGRGTYRATRANAFNRRDFASLQAGLTPLGEEYVDFCVAVISQSRMATILDSDVIVPSTTALRIFAAEPVARLIELSGALLASRGHQTMLCNAAQPGMRGFGRLDLMVLRLLAAGGPLPTGKSYDVDALAVAMYWGCPSAVQEFPFGSSLPFNLGGCLETYYWLGLVQLDDRERPHRVAPTASLFQVLDALEGRTGEPATGVALIPDEPQFHLLPNGEVITPPHLAPFVRLHVLRLTEEPKKSTAGVGLITRASIERALDSGISAESIRTFLEAFSRTGVPAPIATLIQDVARKQGRIRLVPAGYVLVTEDAALMNELAQQKQLAPFIVAPITDRVAVVNEDRLPALMKAMRARGYAPADVGADPPARNLPLPTSMPTPTPLTQPARPSSINPQSDMAPEAPGGIVTDRESIAAVLSDAWQYGFNVDFAMRLRPKSVVSGLPISVGHGMLALARDGSRRTEYHLMSEILWVRLTGEESA